MIDLAGTGGSRIAAVEAFDSDGNIDLVMS